MKKNIIPILLLLSIMVFPSQAISAREQEILSGLPYVGDISQINMTVDHALQLIDAIESQNTYYSEVVFFDGGNGIPVAWQVASQDFHLSNGAAEFFGWWWNGSSVVEGGAGGLDVMPDGTYRYRKTTDTVLYTARTGTFIDLYYSFDNGMYSDVPTGYLLYCNENIEELRDDDGDKIAGMAELYRRIDQEMAPYDFGSYSIIESEIYEYPNQIGFYLIDGVHTLDYQPVIHTGIAQGFPIYDEVFWILGEDALAILHEFVLYHTPTSPESDFRFSNGTITQYVGEGGYVVVPAYINGEKVTKIGSALRSGYSCSHDMDDIARTPTTVTVGAFGGEPFSDGGMWYELQEPTAPIVAISLPDTLVELGSSAFGHGDVKHIQLNKSLKIIEEGAFIMVRGLRVLQLPEGLTHLGDFSLTYVDLTNLYVPASLTYFGNIFADIFGGYDVYTDATIHGYNGSDAHAYAVSYDIPFVNLGDPKPGFTLNIPDSPMGFTTASPSSPYGGQTVTIYPSPDSGHAVKTIKVTGADGNGISLDYDPASKTYSYTQPEMDVTVEVSYGTARGISVVPGTNGNIYIPQEEVAEGSRVVVYFKAEEGFMVDEVIVIDGNGTQIPCGYDRVEEVYAYIQPAGDVEVRINFVLIGAETYPPIILESDLGTCTTTMPNPNANAKVPLEITPNMGFLIQKVIITDSEGRDILSSRNEQGYYEYIQPASVVTIEVQYIYVLTVVNQFTDITEDLWHTPYVAYVYQHGLMDGVGDGLFAPDDITTRAMVAVILAKTSGEYIPKSQEQLFHDVELGGWYSDAIAWCKERGIVAGYDDGNFGAHDPITREQMLTIMYEFAKYNHLDTEIYYPERFATYADSPTVSFYAVTPFSWALGLNYIQLSSNELHPLNQATRADFAQILNYFLEANHNTQRVAMTSFSNLGALLGRLA